MSSALSSCLLCGARFVLLPESANLLLRVFFFSFLFACMHFLEQGRVGKQGVIGIPALLEWWKINSFAKEKLVWKVYYCSS